jgi:hypothetical protein
MLYAKKIAAAKPLVPRMMPPFQVPFLVPTRVETHIRHWAEKIPVPKIPVGTDGTITIPAVATTTMSKSADVMKSFGGESWQLLHNGGSLTDPGSSYITYDIMADEDRTMYLAANISNWHINEDLALSTNTSPPNTTQTVPVFYTHGEWSETPSIPVKLVKGKNTLKFTRLSPHEIAIKEFFLFKTAPAVPMPPGDYTPAPTPAIPPSSVFIVFAKGLTCQSQGILEMDERTCGIDSADLKFAYTGSRVREYLHGCFAMAGGKYAGNSNFNSNTSANHAPPASDSLLGEAVAVCIRK